MKFFIKSACIAFVLTVIYSMIPFRTECKEISNEVFRLHILANSDEDYDQQLKLKVRDKVLIYTESLFESAQSKEEAENLISKNLQDICNTAQKEVSDNGYDYSVTAQITKMYFTTRTYESYTLPSGMYDALRITIGSGEGHNWWCVMYPALCIGAAANLDELKENTTQEEYKILDSKGKYEYKFLLLEYIQKIGEFFSFNK